MKNNNVGAAICQSALARPRCTPFALVTAAKVFRLGILLTGTKGTLGQVARLPRA